MAAAKKKTSHHTQKTVSFRLPDGLMEELRALAKRNRRTLSGELQLAIEGHLHNHHALDPIRKNERAGRA